MAARTKKPNKPNTPKETRAAEAATIAWALSMLAACAAEIVAGLAYALVLVWVAVDEKRPNRFGAVTREMLILPNTLLMIALVTGIVCLVLTVLATRIRKTPPPRAVTRFAIVVGAAPIILLVIVSFVR